MEVCLKEPNNRGGK